MTAAEAGSGHAFPLDVSKLTVPPLRDGLVDRPSLRQRLGDVGAARVVRVSAPAGYGKTTLLAQWAASDPRPFAWVSLDRRDNDPVVFLTYVAAALDRITPVGADTLAAVDSASAGALWVTTIPRLCAALERGGTPLVLVLDDDHELEDQDCLDAVTLLARQLPQGSLLALAGRGEGRVPLARLRLNGELVELTADRLAFGDGDARELLARAGVELAPDDADALNARAEGWAGGLYLAALALRDQAAAATPATFAGDDRLVADYLRSEHLGHLSPQRLRFLRRTSVLERMSAPLCDAVLEESGSAGTLEALERENLFVVALDRSQQWFRYHHLFRDALRRELERNEPDEIEGLHRRAAAWLAANGSPEAAIDHCEAAGDVDAMARLVGTHALPFYRSGRVVTAERWFDRFDDAALLDRYPVVAVLGAWIHALRGRSEAADRWAACVARSTYEDPMPDGSPSLRPWAALVRAALCRHGVARMRDDAREALDELPPTSPWRPVAAVLHGVGALLAGDEDGEQLVRQGGEEAAAGHAVFAGVVAYAQLALCALRRGDVARAEADLAAAEALAAHAPIVEYTPAALMVAARARLAQRHGRTAEARDHLARAQLLRPNLTQAQTWLAVQARLELAEVHAAVADAAGARALLAEARETLAIRPGLGTLGSQAEALGDRLGQMAAAGDGWASTLTAAELRLLPLLTTHLSFQEIGERLYVSRNTVKTQAMSTYRKLGASSRSEAISRAAELGLVDATVVRRDP